MAGMAGFEISFFSPTGSDDDLKVYERKKVPQQIRELLQRELKGTGLTFHVHLPDGAPEDTCVQCHGYHDKGETCGD